jgi:hypothetical protein
MKTFSLTTLFLALVVALIAPFLITFTPVIPAYLVIAASIFGVATFTLMVIECLYILGTKI